VVDRTGNFVVYACRVSRVREVLNAFAPQRDLEMRGMSSQDTALRVYS